MFFEPMMSNHHHHHLRYVRCVTPYRRCECEQPHLVSSKGLMGYDDDDDDDDDDDNDHHHHHHQQCFMAFHRNSFGFDEIVETY